MHFDKIEKLMKGRLSFDSVFFNVMGLEEIKKKFIKEYIILYNVLHKMDNNEKEISASIRFLG